MQFKWQCHSQLIEFAELTEIVFSATRASYQICIENLANRVYTLADVAEVAEGEEEPKLQQPEEEEEEEEETKPRPLAPDDPRSVGLGPHPHPCSHDQPRPGAPRRALLRSRRIRLFLTVKT